MADILQTVSVSGRLAGTALRIAKNAGRYDWRRNASSGWLVHEASIVRELLSIAEGQCPPGQHILSLQVSVGRLTSVSPDAMQFYFEAMRDETVGSQAALEIRLEPLRARCATCERLFELESTAWLCPVCSDPRLVFENGDELDLRSLVVEDGEADHDRTEDPAEERRHRGGESAGD